MTISQLVRLQYDQTAGQHGNEPGSAPHTARHVRVIMRAIGFESDFPRPSWRRAGSSLAFSLPEQGFKLPLRNSGCKQDTRAAIKVRVHVRTRGDVGVFPKSPTSVTKSLLWINTRLLCLTHRDNVESFSQEVIDSKAHEIQFMFIIMYNMLDSSFIWVLYGLYLSLL